MTPVLPLGTIQLVASLLQAATPMYPIKEFLIGNTNSGIWYQLKDYNKMYISNAVAVGLLLHINKANAQWKIRFSFAKCCFKAVLTVYLWV